MLVLPMDTTHDHGLVMKEFRQRSKLNRVSQRQHFVYPTCEHAKDRQRLQILTNHIAHVGAGGIVFAQGSLVAGGNLESDATSLETSVSQLVPTTPQRRCVSNFPLEYSSPSKEKAEKPEFEAWPNESHDCKLLMPWRGLSELTTKSVGHLQITQSITSHSSGDFQYVDARIASGLEKLIKGDVKRRVFVDTQPTVEHQP